MSDSETSPITPEQVLERINRVSPITPIEIKSDAMADGLSMAMMPFNVDWPDDGAEEPVIHRVNIGSNPVTGRSHFASLLVPIDRLVGVEFVTVNAKVMGRDTPAAHAQLRFLFEDGEGPVLVNCEGEISEPAVHLEDLIVSWEAWRSPGQGFSFLAGLDEETYSLSPRAYEGAQRFLEDGLKNSSWNCFPLDLPGGVESCRELLRTSLLAGDGLTRSRVQSKLSQESANELDETVRAKLAAWAEASPDSNLTVDDILEGNRSYQLLKRSCITMSLYTVDLCLSRLFADGKIEAHEALKIVPDSTPDWIGDLAHASALKVTASFGKIVRWLHQNSTVVPASSYQILDRAGLLQTEKGKPVVHHYDLRNGQSPYGNLKDSLIF